MHSLNALENAVTVLCESCHEPIDVWLNHGLVIGRSGATVHPAQRQSLASGCLPRTHPLDQRQAQARAYSADREFVQEAGIPPHITTYRLTNQGKAGTWSDGFLAIGYAVQIPDWDSGAVERQPYITILPSGPVGSALSFVFFAAMIYHRDVKLAILKMLWPLHDLSLPERLEIVNGLDRCVSEADLHTIIRGRQFWRETERRGRGVGTGSYASADEFAQHVDQLLTMHERDG